MKVEYRLYNPNKNYTVLVKGNFDKDEKLNIAKKIFDKEPTCEQVGFVSIIGKVAVIEMAGGEFCGNASMCAALMTGLNKVKCSGNDEILSVEVNGDTCTMSCVILPTGLDHKVFLEKPDRKKAEEQIRNETKPTGYMFLDGDVLTPLVYIPKIDTLFWENACASGCIATGDYLYKTSGENVDMDIQLPGGVMNIKVNEDGYKLTERILFEKDGFIE
ncbi:MAG: hypothetical protein Q4E99_05770 [Bacillota bacterium]|nr:hypothetical protein [Bacillota bacterium]